MDPNPYEPSYYAGAEERKPGKDRAESLLGRWERRRIWFNVVFVTVTLLVGVLPPPLVLRAEFWEFAIGGAITANICYCLGAVAEWYLSGLGLRGPVVGWFLFLAGTVFSAFLTLIAIFINFVPFPG
jgi:hypothetical protein